MYEYEDYKREVQKEKFLESIGENTETDDEIKPKSLEEKYKYTKDVIGYRTDEEKKELEHLKKLEKFGLDKNSERSKISLKDFI